MTIYGHFAYIRPLRRIIAFDTEGVLRALETIDDFLSSKQKGYFVGYMTYEAGVLLSSYYLKAYKHLYQKILDKHKANTFLCPLLYFTLFANRYKTKVKTTITPDTSEATNVANSHKLSPKAKDNTFLYTLKDLDSVSYRNAFNAIKEYIYRGDSYQINFTQEMWLHSTIDAKKLFRQLALSQDTSYKAYIKNPFMEVLCFSPELFFEINGSTIVAQPMKGTIKRDLNKKVQDNKLKKMLQEDSKNRSENIMIVDLLRNDLSRIIEPHSLEVKELCAIHSYPSLHQMVSTLQGRLKTISLVKILQSLFPCGSITGAPKLKTMELIYELESRLRNIYCGALGVINKNHISLCVPIRTLFRYADESFYRYGVGSGVVWDSQYQDELNELKLKSQFLQTKPINYELFETMLYEKGHIFLLCEHLVRIYQSASTLGFDTKVLENLMQCLKIKPTDYMLKIQSYKHRFQNLNKFISFETILKHYSTLSYKKGDMLWHRADTFFQFLHTAIPHKTCIIKLILSPSGELKLFSFKLEPLKSSKLLFSAQSIDKNNPLIFHKTSQRAHFASAQSLIEKNKVFDMVYINKEGYITEGSRSNIICQIGGKYYTPKSQSGLLCGTFRAFLLGLKLIEEKELKREHLQNAECIFCINSVRGIVQVNLGQ